MVDPDFNELSGRIEGLAQAFLHLAALAEMQGQLDGQRLTEELRQRAESWPEQPEKPGLVRTLRFLAEQLDDARMSRQSSVH